jgi:glycosyltransferase involved in cell wall biosynthesis
MPYYDLKVLHVLPAYYNRDQFNYNSIASYGGAERYASELALALSNLTPTTLVTFGSENFSFVHKSLKIIILKSKPLLKRFNYNTEFININLVRLISNYDVIHTHQYLTDTALIAELFAKFNHKKIYVTDLGFKGLNVARYFPIKKIVDKYLCLTEYDIQRLKIPENKIAVIHAGVNLEKYKYTNMKSDYVLFLGRLMPHKGIDYIIRGLDNETKCVIAGHPYNKDYLAYLKRIAKGKKVEFKLSPSDHETLNLLRRAIALILPSVDTDYLGNKHNNAELFGLVIVEAFACGTPVIVSDSSALPYVVKDGVNGFIIGQNKPQEIFEKIKKLTVSPELIEELGSNGRSLVEIKYNWDNVAKLALNNYLENV